jgi:succinate dehydrogenase/fumarate reductase flavoprotein subunit
MDCIFYKQQKEVSKAKAKMQKMTEDHKKDNEDALSRKIKEIEELKKQLQDSIEEQERQSVQTQAHKQVLEKITMEKEALQVRMITQCWGQSTSR